MTQRGDVDIHELSDDLFVIETNNRILQEVSCADDWDDVADILDNHRPYYNALAPRVREYLNARIKDLMNERLGDGSR